MNYGQQIARWTVLAGTCLSLFTSPALAAKNCMLKEEIKSDKIRFVEVQLKVAALQCRDARNLHLADYYNRFLKENLPYLVKSQTPLKTWLKRSGTGDFDSYLVNMANTISLESSSVSQFCARTHLVAEASEKSYNPLMLLNLLPVAYKSPAVACKADRFAMN